MLGVCGLEEGAGKRCSEYVAWRKVLESDARSVCGMEEGAGKRCSECAAWRKVLESDARKCVCGTE